MDEYNDQMTFEFVEQINTSNNLFQQLPGDGESR
jgi:hypothetical protein